jgi:hypothetical protein
MLGRVIVAGIAAALLSGCECEPKRSPQASETPAGFDEVMKEHGKLSIVSRNALIRGELPLAQQSMRKLLFFMEHVPFPEPGKEYARITKDLAAEVQGQATWKKRAWRSPVSPMPAVNATTHSTGGPRSSSSRRPKVTTSACTCSDTTGPSNECGRHF